MLTPQQFAIMKSPDTRNRFPGKKGDFNFFDQMLKENGTTCPRLEAIWERVFPKADIEAQAWLKQFSGSTPVQIVAPQGKPVPSIVKRAMNVLNSYKKP